MKSTLKQKILAILCTATLIGSTHALVGCEDFLIPTEDPKPGITGTETPNDKDNQGKPGDTQNTPGQTNPGQSQDGSEEELPIDPKEHYDSDTAEFMQEMKKVENVINEIKQNKNFKMDIEGDEAFCGKYEIGNDIIKYYDYMDVDYENPIYYYEENGQKYKINCIKRGEETVNYKNFYDDKDDELNALQEKLEKIQAVPYDHIERGLIAGEADGLFYQVSLKDGVLAIEIENANGYYNNLYIHDIGKVENKLPEEVADFTFVPDYDKVQEDIRKYVEQMIKEQNFTYYFENPEAVTRVCKRVFKRDGTKSYIDDKLGTGEVVQKYYQQDDDFNLHIWYVDRNGFEEVEGNILNLEFTTLKRDLGFLSKIVIEKDSYSPVKRMYFARDEEKGFKYWIRLEDDGTIYCERYYIYGEFESYMKFYDVGNTSVTLPERKVEYQAQAEM